MNDAFNTAFAEVGVLVELFKAGQEHYLSPKYQEEEARRDFIDKFWTYLGWDVNHNRQTDPYAQEVKVERGVTMSEGRKRADYAFYLAPDYKSVRFFVEAKKPSVEIENKDSYFQAVRYGWNGGNPLVVLTDFEQFHILDCRAKPSIDSALGTVVRKFHYTDYADRDTFGQIYWLFGREAVAGGALERFVTDHLPKATGRYVQRGLFHGGTQSIDESFLRDLDGYRGDLARVFSRANPALDSETLTEATQRVLDRLVFMRFLEDKLIEPEPLVARFGAKGTAWEGFKTASRRLDTTYNGNIFKPHLIDRATFHAPDDAFGRICFELASDQSPYLFNIIPIHILGSIYERFLGKVIVADADGAKVEEKPEVRKAGGVYYTPDYIVRYIVGNTVGTLIEGKTPAEVMTLRFADIACGSGSFLLGVYDLLLRHHTAYYNARAKGRAEEARKAGCENRDGAWHLSLWQKREILLNNVYGVDIDAQAVEVAQVSLYLKLLEDETTATAHEQNLLHGAILPTLNKNIVFGNSLIGTDILQDTLFEPSEERKLNPMDFKQAFPQIMSRGGFDAVVGNPPYVRIQGFPRRQISYFSQHYMAATGNYDLYVNFVERGYSLLKAGGRYGQILPNKFLKTEYGKGLRSFISSRKALNEVVNFGASQVFAATTYTCLLFLSRKQNEIVRYVTAEANAESLVSPAFATVPSDSLDSDAWLFASDDSTTILKRLTENATRLLDIPAEMSRGSSSGDDNVFVVDADADLEEAVLRDPIFATDFNRYQYRPSGKSKIIFPYEVSENTVRLYKETELQERFPKAYQYLLSKQDILKKRKQYAQWFAFSAPRNLVLHDHAQIIVPLLANRGLFALIPPETNGSNCPMASGGFTITLSEESSLRPEYVLGLLNSKLLFWNLQKMSNVFRGGWITCTKQYLGELPIRRIDFSDPADKTRHDKVAGYVEQMLSAKKELAAALTDRDMEYWQRRCEGLDRQIDEVVYDLYGLTQDEIDLVEGTTGG